VVSVSDLHSLTTFCFLSHRYDGPDDFETPHCSCAFLRVVSRRWLCLGFFTQERRHLEFILRAHRLLVSPKPPQADKAQAPSSSRVIIFFGLLWWAPVCRNRRPERHPIPNWPVFFFLSFGCRNPRPERHPIPNFFWRSARGSSPVLLSAGDDRRE
jgi:hypothetical protein